MPISQHMACAVTAGETQDHILKDNRKVAYLYGPYNTDRNLAVLGG